MLYCRYAPLRLSNTVVLSIRNCLITDLHVRRVFTTALALGSPFLLSLSAQTCNVGITLFRLPLSTGPWLLLLLLLFLQSKRFVDQGGFRRAFAQGVSDHWQCALETWKGKQVKTFAMTMFVSQNSFKTKQRKGNKQQLLQ